MPATTMTTPARLRADSWASSRWTPATPTSTSVSTGCPSMRTVSSASSATGRSLVPAVTTRTGGPSAGVGAPAATVRATGLCRASGMAAARARAWSSPARVASMRPERSHTRRAIAAACTGVLPAQYTTSGKPARSARW